MVASYRAVREAFDVEAPPCPPDVLPGDHSRALEPLQKRYGLDKLYDAWNGAGEKVCLTIAAI